MRFVAAWGETTFALNTYLAVNACANGVMLTVNLRSTSMMSAMAHSGHGECIQEPRITWLYR